MLSRRAVLEEERKEVRQQILDRLQPGHIVEGQISNIVDFGAFVDLDGIDGLIHISELSWSHVNHPSEILNIGETVQVKVLDIDRDRQRISLGLKQTQEDPWQRVVDTYRVGDELEGTVTKVVTFGAFVEILDGVEGLVHISELAAHHVENPRELVSPGDDVKVKILEIDSERRRLSLSIKRVEGQVLAVPGSSAPGSCSAEEPDSRTCPTSACPRTCSPGDEAADGRGRRGGAATEAAVEDVDTVSHGRAPTSPCPPRPSPRPRPRRREAEAEAEAPAVEAEEPGGGGRGARRGGRGRGRGGRGRGRRHRRRGSGRGDPGGRAGGRRAHRRVLSRVPFVGLTGGLGAGKITALDALGRLGAATLSTDAVVHELYDDPEVRRGRRGPLGPGGGRRTARVDRAAWPSTRSRPGRTGAGSRQLLWPRVGGRVAAGARSRPAATRRRAPPSSRSRCSSSPGWTACSTPRSPSSPPRRSGPSAPARAGTPRSTNATPASCPRRRRPGGRRTSSRTTAIPQLERRLGEILDAVSPDSVAS